MAKEGGDSCSMNHRFIGSIGGICDNSFRVGKEQEIAMELALQDVHHTACSKRLFNIIGSYRSSARARGFCS